MKYYFFRLKPPRATFPADMTPAEGTLMREHVAYWTDLSRQGHVIAFGPVAHPEGSFGIGILQLPDEDDAQALAANDPVVRAGIGFGMEVHPMPRIVLPA